MKALENVAFRADSADLAEVLSALAEAFDTRPGAPRAASLRTYWDSFDWRLWRDGDPGSAAQAGRLSTRPLAPSAAAGPSAGRAPGAPDLEWLWRRPQGDELRLLTRGIEPAFLADLPAGPFREALSSVLSIRRLLPQVRVEVRRDVLRVHGEAGKVVARLWQESSRVEGLDPLTGRHQAAAELPPILRVREVRGYDEWRKVADWLRRFGLVPDESTRFTAALAAVGRTPGGYSSKTQLDLDPGSTAGEATVTILRDLAETLRANEEGTCRDLDTEFLHDFRVAIRRTRTALSRLRGVLPAAEAAHFSAEFKWLGALTGVVRDLDVHLLKMPEYEADLPAAVGADLAPLRDHLERSQIQAQADLAMQIRSPRCRELMAEWTGFLAGAASAAECPRAALPVREVASAEIWRIYCKILKRGRRIDDDSPDDDVHDLRKDCKKLRYLLEFFRSLYPAADVEHSIKALKRLQDVLGDFNDFSVQRDALSEMADEMQQKPGVPASALLAMGRLVGHFEGWQAVERDKFPEAFADFASRRVVSRYRQLFRPRS